LEIWQAVLNARGAHVDRLRLNGGFVSRGRVFGETDVYAPLIAALVIISSLLFALNLACWLLFRWKPSLLLSENERLALDYLARFEGEMKPFIPQWFDIAAEDWPEFTREYRALEIGSHVYDDFVEFKHPKAAGRFRNFDAEGFRHVRVQGPWPPSRDYFNIFFFGGSTTLNVGPDWTSIPSYLQDEINQRLAGGKAIRIYNFGRGSYFSTQERILFQQLLLAKAVPDMAIFLDGVNDFYFFHGRPATYGFFQQALDAHNRENYERSKSRTAADPKWAKLTEFLWSLPLVRAFEAIGETLAKRDATADQVLYKPIPIDHAELVAPMERYLANKRQITAICRDYGVVAVFVWQPTPAYRYDLSHHIALNRHYGLGGHERSGAGYALMRQTHGAELDADTHFVWLADIQENERQALYLDNMHYTSAFSRIIAQHIADALIGRGLIDAAVAS
jgi:hypothetical protein